ncbi:hypothetical protein HWI79_1633 [Cryptosporidium felis]|nr:hypothetical protein HWI79_1633 [Cryptosporidium felis]
MRIGWVPLFAVGLVIATYGTVARSSFPRGCSLIFESETQPSGSPAVCSHVLVITSNKSDSMNKDPTLFLENGLESKRIFTYILIFEETEIGKFEKYLIPGANKMHFRCGPAAVQYIIQYGVNRLDFLEKECIQVIDFSFRSGGRRKLKSVGELEVEFEEGNLNDSKGLKHRNLVKEANSTQVVDDNVTSTAFIDDNENKSSCLRKKNRKLSVKEMESYIPSDFGVEKQDKGSGLDIFDISEIVESSDSKVNFEIEFNGKDSIFGEILNAMKEDSEPQVNYTGFVSDDLSSSQLKEALLETEKVISHRKEELSVNKRTSNSEFPEGREGGDIHFRSLGEMDGIQFEIGSKVSGVPITTAAISLTSRFLISKEDRIKVHMTRTKIRMIFLAIYQFLILYSTIESNLYEIVEIMNMKDGILKLRSFFKNHINFTSMNNIFEEYTSSFNLKKKRVHINSDFIRLIINMNINKLDPKVCNSKFVFKLIIASRIMFYSESDTNNKKICIEEEVNKISKTQFYRDTVFFNSSITKHLNLRKNEVLKKTYEAITQTRRENPLDRPKKCYFQVKYIITKSNLTSNISNINEIIKVICLKTYGLLGLLPLFNSILDLQKSN